MTAVEFRGDLWLQKTRVPGLSCGIVCVILRLAVLVELRHSATRCLRSDAKSCRGTGVATSSSMRPIATAAQLWRGRSIHASYCYRRAAVAWSVHPCGLLLQTCSSGVVGPSMQPIAADVQQWRGRSIHAAYCYRRAAVAWSVHPCGLLLLGLWVANVLAFLVTTIIIILNVVSEMQSILHNP